MTAMHQNMTTIERAFQLARSGQVETLRDLKQVLKSEGYSQEQIEGRSLLTQLKNAIAEATRIGSVVLVREEPL